MLDPAIAADQRKQTIAAVWLVGFFVVAIGGLVAFQQWPGVSAIWRCDEAIKATLRAPATYERVSPTIWEAAGWSTSFPIEYDAQNAMGVALRGRGYCMAGKGHDAVWLERE